MTMRRSASTAALVVLIGLFAPSAQAELQAWLDFNGAIPGESTHYAHPGWIVIHGFNFDASRVVSSGSGGHVPGNTSVSEMSLVKSVDAATTRLFSAATAGNSPYEKVTLDLNIANDQPIVRVELEDVLVTSQSFKGSSGGASRPEENISLNFTKITYTYLEPNEKTTFTSYNLATGVSTSGGNSGTDSDNDGMLDSWETFYGLSVGSADSNGDLDGDGLTNLQEFQLGTLPNSGNSFFKAELTSNPSSPGNFQIQWNSVVGKTYLIEWSPDLATPFTSIRVVTATAASTSESITKQGNLGFYRVRPQ